MVQPLSETTSFMTEEGIVESLSQGKAVVRIEKGGHCKNCSSREGCSASEGGDMRIDLANELGARVGDRVEISLPTRSLMKLSVLVYLLPVLALILGAYLGGVAGARVLHSHSPVLPVACGAFAMAAAFFGLRRVDRRAQVSSDYRPRITRILISVSMSGAVDSK